MQLVLADEQATLNLAQQFAASLQQGSVIYLHGNLGAGKTCFCRGVLQALGVQGRIKSPTFTLVEPYDVEQGQVFHFDFYRLADPEETAYLGIADYENMAYACFMEWPEKAQGYLPKADIEVTLQYQAVGRNIELLANTPKGEKIIELLTAQL